jgi:phosphatidylinositol 4-kinase
VRFCHPPSPLDVLIVDQLGCMVLAKSEVHICDEIMRMFTSITVEDCSTVYSAQSQGGAVGSHLTDDGRVDTVHIVA